MSKHTPGPWAAGWGGGITGPNAARMLGWKRKVPIRVGQQAIAAVPEGDPDHLANAHLIAAAPELLELVEYAAANSTVTDSDDPGCFWCNRDENIGHDPECRARAAIAKARGES